MYHFGNICLFQILHSSDYQYSYKQSTTRAVRPVPVLRHSRHNGRHFSRTDLYQNKHGRGRGGQIHRDAHRRVPVHHRRINRPSGLFRLPHIKKETQTYSNHQNLEA